MKALVHACLLLVSARDITERKRAEDELKCRNEEMVRLAYVNDVKARNEKAQAEDVGYIRTAADKMENLLNELLDLSRIGRKTNPPQEIPLQAVAQSAIDLVSGLLSKGWARGRRSGLRWRGRG